MEVAHQKGRVAPAPQTSEDRHEHPHSTEGNPRTGAAAYPSEQNIHILAQE